jgi:hypothetical protein
VSRVDKRYVSCAFTKKRKKTEKAEKGGKSAKDSPPFG